MSRQIKGQVAAQPGEEVVTSVRLPREQYDALRTIAARDHRTFSHQLRFVVEQYLATDDGRPVAA